MQTCEERRLMTRETLNEMIRAAVEAPRIEPRILAALHRLITKFELKEEKKWRKKSSTKTAR